MLIGFFMRQIPFICIFLFILSTYASTANAESNINLETHRPLKALILVSASYGRPGIEAFNKGFLDAWNSRGMSTTSVTVHYLDMNRGNRDSTKNDIKKYILSRESKTDYDLIVLVQQDAVDFFFEELNEHIAPDATLLIAFAKTTREILKHRNRRAVTPLDALEFNTTIDTALKLFPKTKNIVLASGNAASDKAPFVDFLKNDAIKYKNKVQFDYPQNLTFFQMKKMLSTLGPDTIVLRGSYGTDVSMMDLGKTPVELGLELSHASSVPNFVLFETAIGSAPVVGGQVQPLISMGGALLSEGLKITRRNSAGTLIEAEMPSIAVYDHSQVIRHSGRVSALPAHAKILNRPSSIWVDYKWEAASLIVFIISLLTAITAMLFERKKTKTFASRLEVSQRQLQAIIDHAPHVAIQKYDRTGLIKEWNPASTTMFGWTRSEAVGKTVRELLGDSKACVLLENSIQKSIEGKSEPQHRKTIVTKDGTHREILTTCFQLPSSHGQFNIVSMDVDVTELKRHEDSLLKLASVFEHATEGLLIADLDGRILSVNDALCKISGVGKSEIEKHHYVRFLSIITDDCASIQDDIEDAVRTSGFWRSEIFGRTLLGEPVWLSLSLNIVKDHLGRPKHLVGLIADISELKQKQFTLERLAHYDRLTDLPNRVLFSKKLHLAMSSTTENCSKIAVLYIDLDGFKQINDQHGHDMGDQLLVEIARRMKGILRGQDTIARLGGDEFAAVLTDLFLDDDIQPLLERLIHSVSKPVIVNARELRVTASVGVCFYHEGQVDADQLLRHADQAMYAAKQSGKNRFRVFDSEHERTVLTKNNELLRLQQALLNREFVLHYQPKVNAATGTILGVEALIRWIHPERGLVPPGLFLPLIENHPLSVSIGEWVLDEALSQAQRWFDLGYHIPISINVDGTQLAQHDFVEKLASSIALYPSLPRHTLELEILESSALDRVSDIGAVIRRCSAMGVDTSLDDFGTGYSTLSYLKELPVNVLKIDQSFIRNIINDESKSDLAIIQAILGLAHGFGREVIVEGVETSEHIQVLLALGCEKMQGYAFSKPIPADSIIPWINTEWKRRP